MKNKKPTSKPATSNNPKASAELRSTDGLGFWLQPTWPQYRKIVNGEEKCLDGTETADTEIVKYDYNENYKKWRDEVLEEAMKKQAAKKPNDQAQRPALGGK